MANGLKKVSKYFITKTGLENISLTMNYNGLGHRTGKTYSDGKTYSYLYNGNNILEETSNQYTGGVAYYLMGGIDEVFARTINNSPEFYLKDNLNSLRKVIDNTQGILNTADYEPFGAVRNGDTGNHNYLFTGREKDFNDIYYYRARTYSPINGRFQQRDPIGILGGLNLYGYCENNPIQYFDPLGLCADLNIAGIVDQAISESTYLQSLIGQAGRNVDQDNRYIDTEKLGTIDLQHVISAALGPVGSSTFGGLLVEINQEIHGEDSAFKTEDFVSNVVGGVAKDEAKENSTSIGTEVENIIENAEPKGDTYG